MRILYMFFLSSAICLLSLFFLLYVFEPSFLTGIWTLTNQIIGVASAAGTIIAAWATWQAAREAAKSAEIARKSMESSDLSAKATLKETQDFNRRSSFENRYALLLTQHDHYHRQVCDYIDMGRSENIDEGKGVINEKDRKAIIEFFDTNLLAESLEPCLAFLTGHEIISRYMRTLYHLLKFVHSEFYYKETEPECLQKMKNYTSPLRSTIRNDVLCMIAVNALNINSNDSKNSGYPRYQKLLHLFDFFEHAVFYSPFEPNVFGDKNAEIKIQKLIEVTQSKYSDYFYVVKDKVFKEPVFRLFSPTVLCLVIYDNPMKITTKNALSTLFFTVMNIFKIKASEFIEEYKESVEWIESLALWTYQVSTDSVVCNVTGDIILQFKEDAKNKRIRPFKKYLFFPPKDSGFDFTCRDGDFFHYYFEVSLRYEKLFHEFQRSENIDCFIQLKHQQYNKLLDDFYSEVEKYRAV